MPADNNIPACDTAMGLTDAEIDDILGLADAPAPCLAPYSEAALISELIDELVENAVEPPTAMRIAPVSRSQPRKPLRSDPLGPFPRQVAAIATGAPFIVLEDRKRFWAYRDADARAKHCAALIAEGHELIEKIDAGRPFRMPFDLDAFADATDEELSTACEAIAKACAEGAKGLEGGVLPALVAGVDRPSKRSRHLLADGWLVPCGARGMHIQARARDLCPGRIAQKIDQLVNLSSFGFRLPGCPKLGEPGAELAPLTDADKARPLSDWFVQSDARPWTCADPAARPAYTHASEEDPDDLKAFLEAVRAAFPCYELEAINPNPGRPEIAATFRRESPSYCPPCGRVHPGARGAFAIRSEGGGLFLRCRQAKGASGPALHTWFPPQVAARPVDGFDTVTKDVEEFRARFNGRTEGNPDGLADDPTSDAANVSSWGTGKTTQVTAIKAADRLMHPKAIHISISTRKSHSSQLAAATGAKLYTEIKGMLDPVKVPSSVWQLESIGRIPLGLCADILDIDETSQLNAHTYGDNSSPQTRACMTILARLIRDAKRVIISDQDATDAQIDAIRALRPGRRMRVTRNTFQPWAGRPFDIFTGLAARAHVREALWAFLDRQYANLKAGIPWTGAVVACHSRAIADGLALEASGRYPGDDLTRLYTGETDDKVKRLAFSDALTAWTGALVVVYTGTVSVGVDCNTPHFSRCFAFFNNKNAAASQSVQMLMRCRQLEGWTVAFSGYKATPGLPLTPGALYRWAVLGQNRAQIPDEFRDDRNPMAWMTGLRSATVADDLRKVCATFEGQAWTSAKLDQYRSRADFVGRMRAIVERAGLVVRVFRVERSKKTGGIMRVELVPNGDEIPPAAAPEAKQPIARDEIVRRQEAERLDGASFRAATDKALRLRAELAVANLPAAVEAIQAEAEDGNEGVDGRMRSAEEQAGRRAFFVCKAFGTPTDLVEGKEGADWMEYYEEHAEARRRLCRHLEGRDRGPPPDKLKEASEAERARYARRALEVMGFAPERVGGWAEGAAIKSAAVVAFCDDYNLHAYRLNLDGKGKRRFEAMNPVDARGKPLAKPKPNARTLRSSLDSAAGFFGAKIEPAYDTDREKKQGTPSGYFVTWPWTSKLRPEFIPAVAHPGDAPGEPNERPAPGAAPAADAPAGGPKRVAYACPYDCADVYG
jgi:hypothetical protein